MNCITCKQETNNPKFCNRSCAASYNNRKHPKRSPEGNCLRCECIISRGRTYCKKCYQIVKNLNWKETTTLDDLKKGNANNYGYPMIRADSRRSYIRSGNPMKCQECSYDKHVDVCHIKDIASFSGDTIIAEINDLSNLVALCKNHHWEFDHNILALSS
jgi:hypothetical protein